MPDATPSSGGHPFPPPPPASSRSTGSGCLKYGLIGCGALVALLILAGVAGYFWFSRNQPALEEASRGAVQDGARFGVGADEAGCMQEGASRAGGAGGFTGAVAAGAWLRGCLEFSRDTPGFCEDVPPPTAIRRTVEWQRERCGADRGCAGVISVVQTYCTEGRQKRTPADTLDWSAPGGAGGGFAEDTAAP